MPTRPTPAAAAVPEPHPRDQPGVLPVPTGPEALSDACPIRRALGGVTGKWRLLVVAHLLRGPQRFGELRQAIPEISEKVLTAELRALVREGLATRTAHPTVPPRVSYALTPRGQDLHTVMEALLAWGQRWG